MGSDGALATGLAGYKAVGVGDVEGELIARIAGASQSGEPVSRACALNLIVYVDDPVQMSAVSTLVESVADAHPIRAIQMVLDPNAPQTDVQAWVKLDCDREASGRRLCSEEIALTANPDGPSRIASAARALLSPDLPVALWWRSGSPFLSRLFKDIAPMIDKIVVDSIRFGDGAAALDTLHRLREYREGTLALADMNWHRIGSWCRTLSACFDDRTVLALLPDLDHSEIAFSLGPRDGAAGPSARSLLLAAWLVTRMPAMAGHGDIIGKKCKSATPGSIVGLRLFSSSSRAGVSIAWEDAKLGITAEAFDRSGALVRRFRFRPDPEAEAELLYRCIDSVAPDPLLDAVLRVD